MSGQGLLQEVVDDLRTELRLRHVQVLAAVAYLVLAVGGLYLFSSIGEDSHGTYDVHRRTTLAAVGTGITALGVLLCATTLVVDRRVRRRRELGGEPRHLPARRRRQRTLTGPGQQSERHQGEHHRRHQGGHAPGALVVKPNAGCRFGTSGRPPPQRWPPRCAARGQTVAPTSRPERSRRFPSARPLSGSAPGTTSAESSSANGSAAFAAA